MEKEIQNQNRNIGPRREMEMHNLFKTVEELEINQRKQRVLRADKVVTSSSLEIPQKKTLAYLALRTGYHPLSSAPSFTLFLGKIFVGKNVSKQGK